MMEGIAKLQFGVKSLAFAVGLGFSAARLWPIGYVDFRKTQADAKIIEFDLRSEFCTSPYIIFQKFDAWNHRVFDGCKRGENSE